MYSSGLPVLVGHGLEFSTDRFPGGQLCLGPALPGQDRLQDQFLLSLLERDLLRRGACHRQDAQQLHPQQFVARHG